MSDNTGGSNSKPEKFRVRLSPGIASVFRELAFSGGNGAAVVEETFRTLQEVGARPAFVRDFRRDLSPVVP